MIIINISKFPILLRFRKIRKLEVYFIWKNILICDIMQKIKISLEMEKKQMKTINVVAAIIKDGNKIFATQRGYGEFKGGWEFPGGKIEEGETKEEALIREIREELDTEIQVGEHVYTVEYDYPNFHLTMDCYFCSVLSGNLTLKEHEDGKWLTKETLDSVDWLPADLGLIGHLKEIL